MYTQFFGLTEKPFSITPDPRYLYMSQRHADALAHLIYGISQSGGFIQLTGEVGTGKTTLVRSLFEQLPDEADVALILNPELTTEEFLTAITEELAIAPPEDRSVKALVDGLNAYLLQAHGRGRRTVLIVDEAQNLGTEILEQVRLLTNLETPKQKLLQIILIGQPELREVLSRDDMRQVAQRVTGRYHLEPLDQADTTKYVEHRMRVAGAAGSVFQTAAVREIYRRSKGVPRLINVVADRALLAGYAQETRRIDRRLVRRAAAEVFDDRQAGRWRRRLVAGAASASFAGAAALGAALWLSQTGDEAEQPMALATPPPAVAAPRLAEAAEILAVESFGSAAEETVLLSELLPDPALPKDTATAFATLFNLWGTSYLPGGDPACQQAETHELRCWFQRGSFAYLRRLDRPAILSLIGDTGEQYQVVLQELDTDTASLALGDRTYETSLDELSRYWYGDSLILWKPGAAQGDDLVPGMAGEGVRWLRESLTRIGGEAGPGTEFGADSAFFDSTLEERVRAYQRDRRLSVDGIAGTQTQIAINTNLDVPGTPRLSRGH